MTMICGLCKKPIRGEEKYTIDHYECGCEMTSSWRGDLDLAKAERNRLRAALVALIGVDGREELEQLEAVMRLMAAPAEDKAATIDAIHALIATVEAT